MLNFRIVASLKATAFQYLHTKRGMLGEQVNDLSQNFLCQQLYQTVSLLSITDMFKFIFLLPYVIATFKARIILVSDFLVVPFLLHFLHYFLTYLFKLHKICVYHCFICPKFHSLFQAF